MLFKSVLGVSVGNKALSAVLMEGTVKGFKPGSHLSAQFSQEKTLKERCAKAGKLVRDFIQENSLSPVQIRLGISRELVIMRNIRLPLAVKENLRATLNYEIEKYVPLSKEDIHFDYHVTQIDKKNRQITILLAVIKKEDLAQFFSLLQSIGMGAESLEPSSAGIAAILRFYGPVQSEDHAFVWVDEEGLDMGYVQQKALAASLYQEIPAGEASDLTSAVASGLTQLCERNRLEQKVPFLVCGPGSEKIDREVLGKETGLDVIAFNLEDHGPITDNLMVAQGLAIEGVRDQAATINLLPEDKRSKTGKSGLLVMGILLTLLLIGGIAWGASSVLKSHLVNKKLDQDLQTISAEVAAVNDLIRQSDIKEKKIEHLLKMKQETVLVSNVLLEVTRLLPEDSWIEEFSYLKGEFRIVGYAESASELLTVLERSRMFKDLVFLSAITRRYDKEKFRIGFKTDIEG